MKIYLFIASIFFLIWLSHSNIYPEPSWWSIFSSDRSTHTPMIEQVSLVKVSFVALLFAVPILLRRVVK
ncbi:hypothetical protein RYX45_06500 [Alkalihalophilus pseudofirmus]|uniref:Uncharacterized protein n=1 Tax=Alkalihalophilus pseudofirmus TaxID=79885 RepID=A0AAJ2KXD1_ALKPS|nr:hypothetical protein [Alkalihalophilus pseudofirmus]MDV2884821.1 hypothetical protein [Alkalihalophilus pseudofirmus]